jgi:hypothetical protein
VRRPRRCAQRDRPPTEGLQRHEQCQKKDEQPAHAVSLDQTSSGIGGLSSVD